VTARSAIKQVNAHAGLVHRRVSGNKGFMLDLQALTGKLVAYALPPRCPGCGEVVDQDHSFCAVCWQSLDFLTGPGCVSCGIPLDNAGLSCAGCLARRPVHDGVRSVVAYGDVARTLALRLKYARRPGHARTMAKYLARHAELFPGAIIAPVPLHRWRLWSRGYNQAALIASAVAAKTGHRLQQDLLVRVKSTPPLRGLGAIEREKAVRAAFSVRPMHTAMIRQRDICLVDDVYTSGATANACARALKSAGARRVIVLSWARVLRSDDDGY
jgi:ComF family protein